MKIIEDLSLIEKYQMQLKSKFFFKADKKIKPVLAWKSPAAKVPYEVNYLSAHRIWGCYMLDPQNSTRHWNGFGVGEPTTAKATVIDLIISFPNTKDDKEQNAAFIENEKGEILIGHTGDVYRGKTLFWEKYSGEEIYAEYQDASQEKFAFVANLTQGGYLKEIASFAKMVKLIKKK